MRQISPIRLIIGTLLLAGTAAAGGGAGFVWGKSDVTAVVLVKPGIGGFAPVDGSSIGNIWSKDDVKAVVLVEPAFGRYVPRDGQRIGNEFDAEKVVPVIVTEPCRSGLVPYGTCSGSAAAVAAPTPAARVPTPSALIEAHVSGEFNGWDGKTLLKLDNGQVWQQATYSYCYSYAYHPEISIIQKGSTSLAKVNSGCSDWIAVEQIK